MTDYEFIYDIGNGKFASGLAGGRATRVVKRPTTAGRPVYTGVRGRKPIIPADARKVYRHDASSALKLALLGTL